MKPTKMLGLAALAALLAMAFAGASSAMATGPTSLCKADENPCSEANQISHVHETSVGKATLLGVFECNVSFLGDVTKDAKGTAITLSQFLGGKEEEEVKTWEPLRILGSFTYTNCTNNCTVTEENGPTEIQVLREADELARVTYGLGTWAELLNAVCTIFKISCRYVLAGISGHGIGALTSSQLNGSVSFVNQKAEEEGDKAFCPNEGKLDITSTPEKKTYISA